MSAPRAPANRAELIELMVREIEPGLFHPDGTTISGPNSVVTFTRRRSARILAALEAAGVRLVPVKAHDALVAALREWLSLTDGFSWQEIERRCDPAGIVRIKQSRAALALAASPYAPEGRR